MDTKNIIIFCLIIFIVVMAAAIGFLIGQQNTNNNTNVTNITNTTNATNATVDNATNDSPSTDVEAKSTYDTSNSHKQEQPDYNSPDSEYYKWDTDGSYHKKDPNGHYVYSQDAVTGEWSYWADKSY